MFAEMFIYTVLKRVMWITDDLHANDKDNCIRMDYVYEKINLSTRT